MYSICLSQASSGRMQHPICLFQTHPNCTYSITCGICSFQQQKQCCKIQRHRPAGCSVARLQLHCSAKQTDLSDLLMHDLLLLLVLSGGNAQLWPCQSESQSRNKSIKLNNNIIYPRDPPGGRGVNRHQQDNWLSWALLRCMQSPLMLQCPAAANKHVSTAATVDTG